MTSPNVQPTFTLRGNIQQAVLSGSSANTKSDGSGTVGTTIFLAFTPGANDSYIDWIRWMPTASAAATSTTATVGRVYLSTVNSGSTTSSNTFLIAEVTLPSISADSSSVAQNPVDVGLGFRIPGSGATTPLYLMVSNHASPAASTSWITVTFGADY